MGYLIRRMSGRGGSVEIPFLGAHVAEINEWSLTRRGDDGPEAALYDLRAAFSFVSEALWNDPEYATYRVIVVNVGRGPNSKRLRLEQQPGYPTVLNGKSVLMEGVITHDVSQGKP